VSRAARGWRWAAALGLAAACSTPAPAPAPAPAPRDNLVPPAPGEGRHLRNVRQLTTGGNNAEAYFSRSGKQLIFQRQERLESGCDQQYIVNVDGSGLRRVSNGQGRTTCGYFYDHDRQILFSSSHGSSPACPAPPDRSHGYVWPLNELEIYTARADGSDLRALTHFGGYSAEATVSPDGLRIIFTSTKDGDLELYTMRPDGSDLRRITHRVGYDGGAFFAPDGRSIVWRAWYPETSGDSAQYLDLLRRKLVKPARMELWTADADGSNPRQVTRLGGANFAPFFTPDGRHIIFSSNFRHPRSRDFDLYVIGVDGQGLEQVTFDPEFDGFPMFSPDGRRLVWASNRNAKVMGETNLFIADWVP
jgi:Tol biopolymer transport system component